MILSRMSIGVESSFWMALFSSRHIILSPTLAESLFQGIHRETVLLKTLPDALGAANRVIAHRYPVLSSVSAGASAEPARLPPASIGEGLFPEL